VNFPGRRPGSRSGLGLAPTYVRYLSLRLLIFLGVLAVCIALSLRGLPAVLVALLVSGIISYPLARKQRENIVREYQNRRPH
jgi:hypothetical protein